MSKQEELIEALDDTMPDLSRNGVSEPTKLFALLQSEGDWQLLFQLALSLLVNKEKNMSYFFFILMRAITIDSETLTDAQRSDRSKMMKNFGGEFLVRILALCSEKSPYRDPFTYVKMLYALGVRLTPEQCAIYRDSSLIYPKNCAQSFRVLLHHDYVTGENQACLKSSTEIWPSFLFKSDASEADSLHATSMSIVSPVKRFQGKSPFVSIVQPKTERPKKILIFDRTSQDGLSPDTYYALLCSLQTKGFTILTKRADYFIPFEGVLCAKHAAFFRPEKDFEALSKSPYGFARDDILVLKGKHLKTLKDGLSCDTGYFEPADFDPRQSNLIASNQYVMSSAKLSGNLTAADQAENTRFLAGPKPHSKMSYGLSGDISRLLYGDGSFKSSSLALSRKGEGPSNTCHFYVSGCDFAHWEKVKESLKNIKVLRLHVQESELKTANLARIDQNKVTEIYIKIFEHFPNLEFFLPSPCLLDAYEQFLRCAEHKVSSFYGRLEILPLHKPLSISDDLYASRGPVSGHREDITKGRSCTSTFMMEKRASLISGPDVEGLRLAVIDSTLLKGGELNHTRRISEFKPFARQLSSVKIDGQASLYQINFDRVIEPDERVPLLSISANEDIFFPDTPDHGIPDGLALLRGDDDIFYVQNIAGEQQQFAFEYQLQSEKSVASLPPKVQDVIGQYLTSPFYERSVSSTVELPEFVNPEQFQKACFEQCSGVCTIRAWAVCEQINREAGLGSARIINRNNNHHLIEVKAQNGTWVSVDLGGGHGSKLVFADEPIRHAKVADTEESKSDSALKPISVTPIAAAASGVSAACQPSAPKPLGLFELPPLKLLSRADEWPVALPRKALLFEADKRSVPTILSHYKAVESNNVFYLDNIEQLELWGSRLKLTPEGEPVVVEGEDLRHFLDACASLDSPTLVINWDKLPSRYKATMNELFSAKSPTIMGYALPDNLSLISITADVDNEDRAFTSRHDEQVYSARPKPVPLPSGDTEIVIVDVEGKSDWRSQLFGRIRLDCDSYIWDENKSITKALSRDNVQIQIINAPKNTHQEIRDYIASASALGMATYEGLQIPIGRQTTIGLNTSPFDFSPYVDGYSLAVDMNYQPGMMVVNSYLFDSLLVTSNIVEGKYHEEPGLIAQNSGAALNLLVTSNLSDAQWYCLLKTASQFDVRLQINCVPGVALHSALNSTVTSAPVIDAGDAGAEESKADDVVVSVDLSLQASLYLAHNTESALAALGPTKAWCLDVEDFNYGDLVESRGFADDWTVTPHTSDVIKKLDAGEPIILKGEFSDQLLQLIQPVLLTHPNKHFLTLIIELPEGKSSDGRLSFLPSSPEFVEVTAEAKTPWVIQEAYHETEAADEFLPRRIAALNSLLESSSVARLSGRPGVGKSSLMREYARQPDVKVHRGLESIQAWQKEGGVLFLDEANLNQRHLTQFAPLTREDKRVLIDQCRELGPEHKLVIAENEVSSGGHRVAQKLTIQFDIPTYVLKAFSKNYLRANLLNPILGKQVPNAETVDQWYAKYYEDLDIRGLQEQVIHWVLEDSNQQVRCSLLFEGPLFVCPVKLHPTLVSLQTFIGARSQLNLSQSGLGLGGVFIQGRAGYGKTAMVRGSLHKFGYEHFKGDGEPPGRFYCKIDASMPYAQKEEMLLLAFEKGMPVWIDEFDACVDSKLEQLVNQLLVGEHPTKTGEFPYGFMILATGNGISMSGREKFSDALKSRLAILGLPDNPFEDKCVVSFIAESHGVKGKQLEALVTSFMEAQEGKRPPNMRDFVAAVKLRGDEIDRRLSLDVDSEPAAGAGEPACH